MQPFHHDIGALVRLVVSDHELAALSWKTFAGGVAMAKLARQGEQGLVLYRIPKGVEATAFESHTHPAGEVYWVLRGAIVDETGTYPAGSIVWMPPGSHHTPRGVPNEETLVLVMWPGGVQSGVPTGAKTAAQTGNA